MYNDAQLSKQIFFSFQIFFLFSLYGDTQTDSIIYVLRKISQKQRKQIKSSPPLMKPIGKVSHFLVIDTHISSEAPPLW